MEEMGVYPGLSPEEEAVIAEFQEIKLPNGGFRYLISKDNEGRFTITDRQLGTYASEKNTDTGLTLGDLQDRLVLETEATVPAPVGLTADNPYNVTYLQNPDGTIAIDPDTNQPYGFVVLTDDGYVPVSVAATMPQFKETPRGDFYAIMDDYPTSDINTAAEANNAIQSTLSLFMQGVESVVEGVAADDEAQATQVYKTFDEAKQNNPDPEVLAPTQRTDGLWGYRTVNPDPEGQVFNRYEDALSATPSGFQPVQLTNGRWIFERVDEAAEPTGDIFNTISEAEAAAPPGWEAASRGDGTYVLVKSTETPDMGLQQTIEQRVLSGDLEGARQLYNAWQGVSEGRVSIRDAASIVSNIATNPAEFKYLLDAMRGPDDLVAPRDPRYDKDLIEAMASFDASGFAGVAQGLGTPAATPLAPQTTEPFVAPATGVYGPRSLERMEMAPLFPEDPSDASVEAPVVVATDAGSAGGGTPSFSQLGTDEWLALANARGGTPPPSTAAGWAGYGISEPSPRTEHEHLMATSKAYRDAEGARMGASEHAEQAQRAANALLMANDPNPTIPRAQPGSDAWWVLENARYQREKAEYEQQMAARQASLLKYGSQWSAAPFGGGYGGLGSVRTPYADTGARQAAMQQGMLQGPGVTLSDEEARTFDEMQVARSLMQHQNLLSKPRSGRTGAKLFV
jgi:hypothetical protein